MEGRCLLSAVTLQFSPLSAPGIFETTQFSLTSVVGGQQSALSVIAEGGFIDLGGFQSQSMNDHVPAVTAGVGGAGPGSAGVGVSFGGPTVTDILGADSYELPLGNATADSLTLFDTAGGGFSMRPIVISPSVGLSDAMPRVDPGRSQSLIFNQERGGQEGGLVQIDTILKDDTRFDSDRYIVSVPVDETPDLSALESSPAVGATALALSADSDARQPALASAASTELAVSLDQPASAQVPAKSSVISGELARAMVFEMAGGEPAWIRPVVSSEKIKAVAPAVGQDTARADVPSLSPAVAQQAALRASGSRIRITGNQVDFPLPADTWSGWNSAANLPDVVQHADDERSVVRGGFAALGVLDTVVPQVFYELGGGEPTPVKSAPEDDAGSGALVAGSVLALLMLERAAARYKSRDQREILTVVAGPPRV
jgi:hypothetical protein